MVERLRLSVGNLSDSCDRDYIFATVGLYAASWFFRVLRTIYNSGLALTAHLSTSGSDNLLVLTVPVPARFKWQPGQHVFLRFLGLGLPHAWSSHPWTIASAPNSPENSNGKRTLEVVMRVHGGITRVLAKRAAGKPSVALAVWVDGPYGGVPGGLAHYDEVLLLAGGTGE
jgi:NAD(P)H-flavin reductase